MPLRVGAHTSASRAHLPGPERHQPRLYQARQAQNSNPEENAFAARPLRHRPSEPGIRLMGAQADRGITHSLRALLGQSTRYWHAAIAPNASSPKRE